MILSFSKKVLYKYNRIFRIRLERSKRFQYPFYFIVVTNSRDGILKTIGYYNPKQQFYRGSGKLFFNKKNRLKIGSKLFGLNLKLLCSWLLKGAIPNRRLFRVFKYAGVFKNFSVKRINISHNYSNPNINLLYKRIAYNNVTKIFKHYKKKVIKIK